MRRIARSPLNRVCSIEKRLLEHIPAFIAFAFGNKMILDGLTMNSKEIVH